METSLNKFPLSVSLHFGTCLESIKLVSKEKANTTVRTASNQVEGIHKRRQGKRYINWLISFIQSDFDLIITNRFIFKFSNRISCLERWKSMVNGRIKELSKLKKHLRPCNHNGPSNVVDFFKAEHRKIVFHCTKQISKDYQNMHKYNI